MDYRLTNPVLAVWDSPKDGPVNTPTLISWDPTSPAEIVFDFAPPTATVGTTWTMSRDLLAEALAAKGTEVGAGDVIVTATDLHLLLVMRGVNADGDSEIVPIRMPLAAVRWVLNTSAVIVAPGSDREAEALVADFDAELAELLEGGWAA